MRVGLFDPCDIHAFFPELAVATLELLEDLGCEVEYPLEQTRCGQPMASSGDQAATAATEAHFAKCLTRYDTVVGPSASCVHHARFHLDACEKTEEVVRVRRVIRESVVLLHEDLEDARFPKSAFLHEVGLHNRCTATLHEACGAGLDPFTERMVRLWRDPAPPGILKGVIKHGAQGARSLTVLLTPWTSLQ